MSLSNNAKEESLFGFSSDSSTQFSKDIEDIDIELEIENAMKSLAKVQDTVQDLIDRLQYITYLSKKAKLSSTSNTKIATNKI